MVVSIIGIGLIGGSLAISLKENGFADTIIGVDKNQDHIDKAYRRRLIDEDDDLNEAISKSDLIILSVPMNSIVQLLPKILDQVENQIVMEVGSAKSSVIEAIKSHPKRSQFIATHPMAGTEFSGPEAAIPNLFDNKCAVLCDVENSSQAALDLIQKLYASINMHTVQLNAEEHDVHTAYVSHISHISSFALALTVLEKERDEKRIFELASGGFSSTVRLAKSSADMWIPIFKQNKENVLDVLDEHINTLIQFKNLMIENDFESFHTLIEKSNQIKRILK